MDVDIVISPIVGIKDKIFQLVQWHKKYSNSWLIHKELKKIKNKHEKIDGKFFKELVIYLLAFAWMMVYKSFTKKWREHEKEPKFKLFRVLHPILSEFIFFSLFFMVMFLLFFFGFTYVVVLQLDEDFLPKIPRAELATCTSLTSSPTAVQEPTFLFNMAGQTGWFASPIVYDLDGDGKKEVISAYYDIYVFDRNGTLLNRWDGTSSSRVYAPHVVADIDGDGIVEIVAGRGAEVVCLEWRNGAMHMKEGWPKSTAIPQETPEVRGLAAGDLENKGYEIDIVATTTQTTPTADGGAQVYVYNPAGDLYQPDPGHKPAWPRYNNFFGYGNDADRNCAGHSGYGAFGLNVAIGNLDDDDELEILATYDNHHIQMFKRSGLAVDASPMFKNRHSSCLNARLTWGQFIRWADPVVEANHYFYHTGTWPNPSWTEWLQWTHSPPSIGDIDQDGRNEVVGVPNIELHDPYITQAFGIFVLEGNYGDGNGSAMRKPGWEVLPRGNIPTSSTYPPQTPPSPALVDITGDSKLEIIVTTNDGYLRCWSANATLLWSYDYRHGLSTDMYCSEVAVVDLNQDGIPEIIFTTFGDPTVSVSGNLVVLDNKGSMLHDIPLPNPGYNGNGNGSPSAPSVADLTGDGQLEILCQTFDHGTDVFTVPGSAENCMPWPTARGGRLRQGRATGW